MLTMTEMIQAVRTHAGANYGEAGWDILVESWTDQDIAEAIGGAWTAAGAIAKVGQQVGWINAYRSEVANA